MYSIVKGESKTRKGRRSLLVIIGRPGLENKKKIGREVEGESKKKRHNQGKERRHRENRKFRGKVENSYTRDQSGVTGPEVENQSSSSRWKSRPKANEGSTS